MARKNVKNKEVRRRNEKLFQELTELNFESTPVQAPRHTKRATKRREAEKWASA